MILDSPQPQLATITLDPESDVLTLPETGGPSSTGSGFRVILYNDNHHGMDEVIEQLIKATNCTADEAIQVMMEAHTKGRAVCYRNSREKCQKAAKILREIRLQVEVDCD